MTIDRVLLKDLIEKGSDADLLRETMTFVVNRMMDSEVESLTGAAHGERSADRTNHRNGYRERPWDTRAGTIPVAIPKLRKGSYFPSFLEPRRTSEKALVAVIQEAYVQGISTRSVDDLVKAMGMSGISSCRRRAWPRRARCRGCARRSTTASRCFSNAPSKAIGLTFGSTPPT